ncbi:MAG: rod-binding protein [Terriglobales bacterium]
MISLIPALLATSETRHRDRIVKAAQEFEAQLLSTLLGPLEQSFSAVPGTEAGADDYRYMGIQALAGALSGSGGMGIADLLVRQLVRTEVSGGPSGGEPSWHTTGGHL